jgi:hypothetical protein
MPRFLIERDFGSISDEEMQAVTERSRQLMAERFTDVVWERSHVCVDESGEIRSFCIYKAPDAERIREHASAMGEHVIAKMYEIAGDVTPSDFAH